MRSMVFSGEREMAVGPERSKSLHNFQLPCLRWGSRKYLRCVKTDESSTVTDSSSAAAHQRQGHASVSQRRRSPPSKPEIMMVGGKRRRELESESSPAEGIEEVRKKLTKDLKTDVEKIIFWPKAADKNKSSIFGDLLSDYDDVDNDEDEFEGPTHKVKDKEKEINIKEKEKEGEESAAVEVETRPWNLRTRRSACKAPNDGEGTKSNCNSPMKNEMTNFPRGRDTGSSAADDQRPRAKFSVPLAKKEIEKDLMMMIGGNRPPRRPKKRSRFVQSQLDLLFPGFFLREVTADDYKVPESVESGRR